MIVTTPRLTLSPMATSDMEDLVALWSDETFARSIFPAALTEEDVWMRLLRDIGHWKALGFGNWAARETDSGAFVGSVGLFQFRRELPVRFTGPELGWGVAPRFQRRGLALEAVTAALEWAATALEASRTVCMIADANLASLALADRLGYRAYAQAPYRGADYVMLERSSDTGRDGRPGLS